MINASSFNPFASEEVSPAHSEHWKAKRRIAQALRKLSESVVTSAASIEKLDQLADSLENLLHRSEESPSLHGILEFAQNGSFGGWGELSHELNAVGGQSNPLAPDFNMWFEDGRAYCTVSCGWAYEGPPGHVHGGYVAAIFDQFMGMSQLLGDSPGRTGHLDIRYHRPTPLNEELRLEADILRQNGRKTIVRATLHDSEAMTASAEALFITPREGHKLPLSGA